MLALFIIALAALVVSSNATPTNTCSLLPQQQITFYGWPDNDPAGDDIAYVCPGRTGSATGTGTYADPLTLAFWVGDFNECELVYSPYLKKYLIAEDDCATCDGGNWVDIWTGTLTDSEAPLVTCEDDLTRNSGYVHTLVRDPPSNLPVDGK